MDKPNFYAIIPATVRYSDDISSFQKLLFAEITSLTNSKGYCWANNNYFAELYNKHIITISKNISSLVKAGFIDVEVVRDVKNKVSERKIKITTPLSENANTLLAKTQTPLSENAKYNTKDNNKKNILFNSWWDLYNKKVGKGVCESKFMKLDLDVCQKCVDVVSTYVASTLDIKYRKNPITWLNQGCWDDEVIGEVKQGFVGGKYDGLVF
jgi:hypothetical protein|tara:strand:- start:59 stop:691 length:633 start_codon:yes stop_codon:yes gene_type:complete